VDIDAPAVAGTTAITFPATNGTIALTTSPTFTGTISTENINISGTLQISETTEVLTTGAISGGVFTADFNSGGIFYITTAPSANFTINAINIPTTDLRITSLIFFVLQGSTGYIPNAFQINSSAQTIKWSGGSTPTPTSSVNKVDVFGFSLIRRSSTWEIFGSIDKNY
jgi:hypothetical protein